MNKSFRLLGLALLGAMFLSLDARAESAKSAPSPSGRAGIYENLDFYGVKTSSLNKTTTAKLVTSSEGFLDELCAFGGTSGKYTLAWDTGITAGASLDPFTAGSFSGNSVLLTPLVLTYSDTGSLANREYCYKPKYPVRFVNGLVIVNNDASHISVVRYHLSDGSNP